MWIINSEDETLNFNKIRDFEVLEMISNDKRKKKIFVVHAITDDKKYFFINIYKDEKDIFKQIFLMVDCSIKYKRGFLMLPGVNENVL